MFFRLRVLLAVAVAVSAPLAAFAAPQSLPDSQLGLFVSRSAFPIECGSAQASVTRQRVQPTTDPAALHAMIQNFVACAETPYAANDGALFNAAIFAGSAASLLAARGESGAAALADAQNARSGANLIMAYTRGENAHPASFKSADVPSMLVTSAGRIAADATSLIATIGTKAGSAPSGIPVFPATPAQGAGMAKL